jgi:hypothetical protein
LYLRPIDEVRISQETNEDPDGRWCLGVHSQELKKKAKREPKATRDCPETSEESTGLVRPERG